MDFVYFLLVFGCSEISEFYVFLYVKYKKDDILREIFFGG